MKHNTHNFGYRQMLRDRMPKVLDLALRWCKAKERWIDYVYDNVIKRTSKEKRSDTVKIILGIKPKWKRQEIYDQLRYSEFKQVTMAQVWKIPRSKLYLDFYDSINWVTLSNNDPDMYNYWMTIAEWTDWFSKSYLSVKSTYDHSRHLGLSDNDIAPLLMGTYEINRKLADFLIKSFK